MTEPFGYEDYSNTVLYDVFYEAGTMLCGRYIFPFPDRRILRVTKHVERFTMVNTSSSLSSAML